MSEPRRFSLIVFDMDGVLIDSSSCHARAFADLWREIGIVHPPAYHLIAGRSTDSVVRQYVAGLRPAEERIRHWVQFKQVRAREYLREIGTFADVLPVVTALDRDGYRMAVGTGASRVTTQFLLHQAGLEAFFPVVVTADDVVLGKPAPDTFAQAIERSGATPETSLVIEDSAAGLASGLAAGAYAASVRTGERVEHERFIGSFDELGLLLPAIIGSPS